jgi:hypothetical protein
MVDIPLLHQGYLFRACLTENDRNTACLADGGRNFIQVDLLVGNVLVVGIPYIPADNKTKGGFLTDLLERFAPHAVQRLLHMTWELLSMHPVTGEKIIMDRFYNL